MFQKKNIFKLFLFIYFIYFAYLPLFSQESEWKMQNDLKIDADFIEIDAWGSIYAVKNNILSKFSPENSTYKRTYYSNNSYGNISSLDVSNPFNLLVYYSDFQVIVNLDTHLSEISKPIQAVDLEDIEVELICKSAEGGFWIFDRFTQSIKHFDAYLNSNKSSLDFRTLFDENCTPNFMREWNNKLYVNTLEGSFLIFDTFGNLEKTLSLSIEKEFCVKQNLCYYADKKLKIYDFKSLEISEIDLSWKKNILSAKIEQKKLYIFTPEGVSIFEQKE